jgi:hypothetical protein
MPLALGSVVVLNFCNVLTLVYQLTSIYDSVDDMTIVFFISALSVSFWTEVTLIFMAAESTQNKASIICFAQTPGVALKKLISEQQ